MSFPHKGCALLESQTKKAKALNRLIDEKSPYLLQHAHNPVNWHPWGHNAFELAAREDKPVFLSIGYSTCHWCHVMAHESFEDEDVAALLNEGYVCVKVDREERPDIDAVYMAACQMFTGSGGWPLTVIMAADQKPFWVGTYLPKDASYGQVGLTGLLKAITKLWREDRATLLSRGERATVLLNEQQYESAKEGEPNKSLLKKAVQQLKSAYDPQWGGFSGAPKFPTPHNLIFLLRYNMLENDGAALKMAQHTLRQMFRGGIFDHIGGGFSRYSTDEKWLAPHFEKMLYDNALLALAYLKAYHITGEDFFSMTAQRILDYVLRELRDGQGGFYCGQDADSDGVEGKYYVFSRQEIFNVLGDDDGAAFCEWFNVTDEGNFEGKNILNLLDNPSYELNNPRIEKCLRRLYDYRLGRTELHKDDKVLTSWNALMISAMAKAGWLLGRPEYTRAAVEAQDFIQREMTDEGGGLKIRWREGETAHDGQLDDYAFYALALIELYETTGEVGYLRQAIDIAQQMLSHFKDSEKGGFFLYSNDAEQLISRPKETYDGAMPSGNSVAAAVLKRLSELTGEEKWRQESRIQLRFLAGEMQSYPAGHGMALIAMSRALYPSYELVCATSEKSAPQALSAYLIKRPLPNLSLIVKTAENAGELAELAPFSKNYPIPEKGAAYYLCQGGACSAPVHSLADILKALDEVPV